MNCESSPTYHATFEPHHNPPLSSFWSSFLLFETNLSESIPSTTSHLLNYQRTIFFFQAKGPSFFHCSIWNRVFNLSPFLLTNLLCLYSFFIIWILKEIIFQLVKNMIALIVDIYHIYYQQSGSSHAPVLTSYATFI